jgi:hypothetical protein
MVRSDCKSRICRISNPGLVSCRYPLLGGLAKLPKCGAGAVLGRLCLQKVQRVQADEPAIAAGPSNHAESGTRIEVAIVLDCAQHEGLGFGMAKPFHVFWPHEGHSPRVPTASSRSTNAS